MSLRWQKPDVPIWWCMVIEKRMCRHKDRDLWSIPGMSTTEKELAWPQGTGVVPARTSKLKVPKCIDKRRLIWPQGNLGRKTWPNQKSEEDSSGTRKPDAVSPEMENMRFWSSLHGKDIPMHTEETGNNFSKCYVLSDSHKTQCIDMVNVHGIVDASRHSSWTRFLREFGNLQEHKIREHRKCVQHHSKFFWKNILKKFWMWEAWIIHHHHGRDKHCQTTKRSSGRRQKLVYADSVLCIGRMEHESGAAEERWKGQYEDLKKYSAYQDAIGLDGEAIEFEWKNFPGFAALAEKNIKPENSKDGIIFMYMFNDILWKSDDQECISNAEKVKNYAKRFQPGHWTFLGRRSEKRMVRWLSRWTVGPCSQQNGTAIQRKWSSYFHKYQCFESRNLEAEKR